MKKEQLEYIEDICAAIAAFGLGIGIWAIFCYGLSKWPWFMLAYKIYITRGFYGVMDYVFTH